MNENQFTWTIHSIWLRWHNIIADFISKSYPHLSDEAIYQEARKLTVASMQHIIIDEWLPVLLGHQLPKYSGHKLSQTPQINDLFESIIPIYLYSLVSSFVYNVHPDCSTSIPSLMRTCNSYNGEPSDHLAEEQNDNILTGLLLQSAQRDDHFVVEDIRRYAKGPIDFTRQDLIAIIIQQARDFAIPDYLTIKAHFQEEGVLTNYSSFEQLALTLWPFAVQSDEVCHLINNKFVTCYP